MFLDRDKILEIAKEMDIEVTFDNPTEKVGVFVGDKKYEFEELLSPLFKQIKNY